MSDQMDKHSRKEYLITNPINLTEVGKFEITKETAIYITALLAVALFAFGFLFTALYAFFTGKTSLSGDFSIESGLIAGFIFIFTIIFHESIHGFFIGVYGGTPRYGMGTVHKILPYLYTTTDTRFRRNQFIIISLSPLLVITLACIILMAAFPVFAQWMLIPLIINSAGAVADLWMSLVSLRYPKNVLVEDNTIGLTFYGEENDGPINISINSLVRNFVIGSTITFIVIFLLNLIYQMSIYFSTGKMEMHLSFVQLLPICGLIGLVYSIVKSTKTKSIYGPV